MADAAGAVATLTPAPANPTVPSGNATPGAARAQTPTPPPAPTTPTAAPNQTPAAPSPTPPAAPNTTTPDLGTNPAFLAYLRGTGLSLADAQALAQQGTAAVGARLSNTLSDQARANASANLNLGSRLESSGMSNSTTGRFEVAQQTAGEGARQEAARQTAAQQIQALMTNLAMATQRGETGIAGQVLNPTVEAAAYGTQLGAQPGQLQFMGGGGAGPVTGGAVPAAIASVTADPHVRLAMLVGSHLESKWNAGAVGDNGGSVGPFQINHNAGMHQDISMAASQDPAQAARYMLGAYQQAVAQVPAIMWQTDPEGAAALAAYYAERPAVPYAQSQGQGAVDSAYRDALAALGAG